MFCLVPPAVDDVILPEVSACFEGAVDLALHAEGPLFASSPFPSETAPHDGEIVPAVLVWLPSAEEAPAETVVPFEAEAACSEVWRREGDVNALKQLIAAVMMRAMILRCMLILSLKKSVLVFSYGRRNSYNVVTFSTAILT